MSDKQEEFTFNFGGGFSNNIPFNSTNTDTHKFILTQQHQSNESDVEGSGEEEEAEDLQEEFGSDELGSENEENQEQEEEELNEEEDYESDEVHVNSNKPNDSSVSYGFKTSLHTHSNQLNFVSQFHPASSHHLSDSNSISSTAIPATLPVALSGSITAKFGFGSSLFFFSSAKYQRFPTPDMDNIVQYNFDEISPILNPLLYSWNNIFQLIQHETDLYHTAININSHTSIHTRNQLTENYREFLLLQSRRYHAELESFLIQKSDQLQRRKQKQNPNQDQTDAIEEEKSLTLIQSAKSLLHLFEIFYIDYHLNCTVQLIDWLQRTYPPPQFDLETLQIDSEDYWICCYQLIVQGRISHTIELIQQNNIIDQHEPGVKNELINLLITMPTISNKYTDLHSFNTVLSEWRKSVELVLEKRASANVQIERFLSLLLGDETVLINICDTWPELLVGFLLLNKPQTMKEEIPALVTYCIQSIFNRDSNENQHSQSVLPAKPADECCKFIMQFDLTSAIQLVNQMLDFRWFTAHLSDLLEKTGALATNSSQVRNFFLQQYIHSLGSTITSCNSSSNLFDLLFDYANTIQPTLTRQQILSHYLLLSPINSDKDANKLLRLCNQFNLTLEYNVIACTRATHYIRKQLYGQAVYFLCKAPLKGAGLLESVLLKALNLSMTKYELQINEYNQTHTENVFNDDSWRMEDTSSFDSILDNLTGSMPITDLLVFTSRYRDLLLLNNDMGQVRISLKQFESTLINSNTSISDQELLTNRNNLTAIYEEFEELRQSAIELLLELLVQTNNATTKQFHFHLLVRFAQFLSDSFSDQTCFSSIHSVSPDSLHRVLILFSDLQQRFQHNHKHEFNLKQINQIRQVLSTSLAQNMQFQLSSTNKNNLNVNQTNV